MLIKEFSDRTGLSKDTIRFYEKEGLIKSTRKTNGYKTYSEDLLEQVELIQLAKSLGFSLKEIKELKRQLFSGSLSPETVRRYMEKKVDEIDMKIMQLQSVKKLIQQRIAACREAHGSCATLPRTKIS